MKQVRVIFLCCVFILHSGILTAAELTLLPNVTSDDLRDVWGTGAANMFIVGGYDTTILHFDGTHWEDIESLLPQVATADMWGIWGTADDNIFSVGGWAFYGLHRGSILRFNGSYWQSLTENPNSLLAWANELRAVWGSSGTDIFVVGERNYILPRLEWIGPVLHYDGTRVYEMETPRSLTGNADLFDIWGLDADSVFTVGTALEDVCVRERCRWRNLFCSCVEYEYYDYASVMQYDGSSWTLHETGVDADLFGIWGSAADDLFAVGESGTILHYDGVSWTPMESPVTDTLLDVWGAGSGSVFAAGENGTVLRYNGSSWSVMDSPTDQTLNAVWGAADNRVYVVGDNGTILLYSEHMDYGDAPDPSFPSMYANNGARHADTGYIRLGDNVDAESESHSDDLHDDGVAFLGSSATQGGPYSLPFRPGQYGAVTVKTGGGPAENCYLHGWIDWNGDGDWDDDGENILCGLQVTAPESDTYEFQVPETISESCIWSRFRLDWNENICSYEGPAAYGEVEDYELCPTLIELESFTALPLDGSVMLKWRTASEIDNVGFNIYRSVSSDTGYARVNESVIPPAGGPDRSAEYTYRDDSVINGTAYFYRLEDIDLDGTTTLHGPVSATPDTPEVFCSAHGSITAASGKTEKNNTGQQLESCFSYLVVKNSGSRTVTVYWHVTDSYIQENTGWRSVTLEPGREHIDDQPSWGYLNLLYGVTRTVETDSLIAFYSDEDYSDLCGFIGDDIDADGRLDLRIESLDVDLLNPCD